jgi:acyl-CoA hydrolase
MTTSEAALLETRIVEMVFPNQTNHYGTLFGGDALRLIDYTTAMPAVRVDCVFDSLSRELRSLLLLTSPTVGLSAL